MKQYVLIATSLLLGAHPSFGSLVLSSATASNGTGLGSEPTILTIQGNGSTELGCVGSTSALTGTSFNSTGICGSGANDVKSGAGQIGPQTLAAGGVTSASDFAIVFNANQTASGPITLTGLTAAFYSPTGNFLYETSGVSCTAVLNNTCTFPNTFSGTGKAGFVFQLDAAQAAAATAAGAFSNTNNIVGLSASASNVSGGPETFFLGSTSAQAGPPPSTPEPASLFLTFMGVALVCIGGYRRSSVSK